MKRNKTLSTFYSEKMPFQSIMKLRSSPRQLIREDSVKKYLSLELYFFFEEKKLKTTADDANI
jgi:hypothetical protein